MFDEKRLGKICVNCIANDDSAVAKMHGQLFYGDAETIASPYNLRYQRPIHKDPVKPRVALLAADPPDNT